MAFHNPLEDVMSKSTLTRRNLVAAAAAALPIAAAVAVPALAAGDDAELIELVRRAIAVGAESDEAEGKQDDLFEVCAKFRQEKPDDPRVLRWLEADARADAVHARWSELATKIEQTAATTVEGCRAKAEFMLEIWRDEIPHDGDTNIDRLAASLVADLTALPGGSRSA
jgi:hypothetical protein